MSDTKRNHGKETVTVKGRRVYLLTCPASDCGHKMITSARSMDCSFSCEACGQPIFLHGEEAE